MAADLLQCVRIRYSARCLSLALLLTSALHLSPHSFAGFLTNLIGFLLPAYFSMRALDSPQPQDDIQWCVRSSGFDTGIS